MRGSLAMDSRAIDGTDWPLSHLDGRGSLVQALTKGRFLDTVPPEGGPWR